MDHLEYEEIALGSFLDLSETKYGKEINGLNFVEYLRVPL